MKDLGTETFSFKIYNLLFLGHYYLTGLKDKLKRFVDIMGKDCNLEHRKRGLRKLCLSRVLASKMVISNLISKKLTTIQHTQYRLRLWGTWVSNLQMQMCWGNTLKRLQRAL